MDLDYPVSDSAQEASRILEGRSVSRPFWMSVGFELEVEGDARWQDQAGCSSYLPRRAVTT